METEAVQETADGVVEIDVEFDPRINFALQQNDVPVVKSIRIRNQTGEALREVRIEVRSEPDFARCWSRQLDEVPAGAEYLIRDVDLVLSPDYLASVSESVRGLVHVTLTRGDESLVAKDLSVDLLAYDQWSGLQSLPEMLAAFVLPNHPAVMRTMARASEILRGNSQDGSLSGYQSRSRERVLRTTEAIYQALSEAGIEYRNPAPSFENTGQKIRTPDLVFTYKAATCLDLAVLAAACLEQAGLHSLIVIIQGHAFAGVWLDEACFPQSADDDPIKLRKRVDLNEICVFETTHITNTPSPAFATSVVEGRRHLEITNEFLCLIDIHRARKSSIRPLPLRFEGGETVVAEINPADTAAPLEPSAMTIVERQDDEMPSDGPQSRLDVWRTKLLDLTLHNRLLNYKDSRKTLPIISTDIGALEDQLSDGSVFQLRARPGEFSAADPRDPDAFRRRTGDEGLARLVAEELKAKRLCGDVTPEELDRRLIELYRAARISIEEGGASALYLTIGFLRWYETKRSEKPLLAPLLLVPIELERRSIQHGFRLVRGADDTRINTTLLELLRRDFGLNIGGLDPLPQDESGVDVPSILRRFREAVKDIDRWEVLDASAIGFFSFSKFLMWRDLQERAEDLMSSPIVRHLVERDGSRFDPDFQTHQPERLDETHEPKDCFTPLDADSSQLWSVLCAAQGKSFVLWGPPGTGKSQTITNMIAHALATGKTVLFVSEKSAALNVVFSRLRKLGLERFCLELHSNKARKHDVIQQLGEVLDIATSQPSEDWERKANQLAQSRNQLNALVDAMHRRHSNGLTVFVATSRLTGLKQVLRVPIAWPNPHEHSLDTLEKLRDHVDSLSRMAESMGPLKDHPWRFLRRSEWSNQWQDAVQSSVGETHSRAQTLLRSFNTAYELLGVQNSSATRERIEQAAKLAEYMLLRPALPAAILTRDDWQELVDNAQGWTKLGKRRDQLRQEIYAQFKPDVLQSDVDALRASWNTTIQNVPLQEIPRDSKTLADQLDSWIKLIDERARLRTATFKVFKEEVLLADLDRIADLWERLRNAGTLTKWFARWQARRAVRSVLTSEIVSDERIAESVHDLISLRNAQQSVDAVGASAAAILNADWCNGEPDSTRLREHLRWAKATASLAAQANALCVAEWIPDTEVRPWLDKLSELKRLEEQICEVSQTAEELLGRYWARGEADWSKLAQALSWVQVVRALAEELSGPDSEDVRAQREKLATLMTESRDALRADGVHGKSLTGFRSDWEAFQDSLRSLAETLQLTVEELPVEDVAPSFTQDFIALLEACLSSFPRVREWCDWLARRAESVDLGLLPLVGAFESGEFEADVMVKVFDRSYYEWWLGRIVDENDLLRRFSSTEHARLIEKFRAMDNEFLRLTRELVAARLAANVPQASMNIVPNSEMGILQHELRKKRRHTSVRTLVGKIPTLLPRLKPCLLMSPMSVAQYLDPSFPPFDIVVFDEASQIPVWDAVGALARAKQAVVVGDPKQLPPTNFFSRADEDPEDVDETLQDLESVLDDCLGAQIPQLHLDWHYRSRHESLIHFSNHHYYENQLLTFPSPIPTGMGVQWRYVSDGVYGRSKDRTNRPEADRVIEEVVSRLKDPRLCRQSIGVVTFSVAQQALIESLLDVARREHDEIERYFSEDEVEEPVFIKNLENVQGDERDVIIFSICYGPDHNGAVSLNFGPINRSGGERRLNVAITRARQELLVYSSLRADMINLARTKAVGAAHLKTFLDYAERGPIALPSATTVIDGAVCESPLEQEIHDALVARGWQLAKQVGCSGYRIDLAVIHPELEGRYAIGIECDGANYHRAKSARDRDRLREGVLKDLGWELARVWSTDWWTNPERELDKLDEAIHAAIAKTSRTIEDNLAGEDGVNVTELTSEPEPELLIARAPSAPTTPEFAKEDAAPYTGEIDFPCYKPMDIRKQLGSQADFDTAAAAKHIPRILEEVAAAEGPIALTVACRRVAAHWGFQKASGRIQSKVRKHLRNTKLVVSDSGGVEFVWPLGADPSSHSGFRINGPDKDSARNADDIPLEEYENGIAHLLQTHFGMPREDLKTATARLFGFSRTGSAVASRIDLAIDRMHAGGKLVERDRMINLP